MIKKWLVTGDTHGNMKRFAGQGYDEETGIIILGDGGCNYYLNKKDHWTKMALENAGGYYYLVRGNHEARPENLNTTKEVYDEDIQGWVYMEEAYPHIKYLIDGYKYVFNGHSALVIGGAYSVDKWYRLQMGWQWFADEQLTADEMASIKNRWDGSHFDFILSHTCPISWEPIDLFLGGIDQSKVDKSMEVWLNEIKDSVKWDIWLFGHYHADRAERPYVEMCFEDIEDLEDIWARWQGYAEEKDLPWWFPKSPQYYME